MLLLKLIVASYIYQDGEAFVRASVAMDAVTVTDTQIALVADDVLVDGAVFGGFDLVGGTMSNISVTGSSVAADATAESVSYGVWTIVGAEGAVSLDAVEVSDNTIALSTTDGDALAYGVLNAEGVPSVSILHRAWAPGRALRAPTDRGVVLRRVFRAGGRRQSGLDFHFCCFHFYLGRSDLQRGRPHWREQRCPHCAWAAHCYY